MILQELQLIQERCGYLPADELHGLARQRNIPLHRLHEVASYYPSFRLTAPPPLDVRVCRDLTCHLRGSSLLRQRLHPLVHDLVPDALIEGVSCLGRCDSAPNVLTINGHVVWGLSDNALDEHVREAAAGKPPIGPRADRTPRDWQIDPYMGKPRYEALRRYLTHPDPDGIVRELHLAGLRGMGGAGFPTARKWEAVRKAPGDIKYVIGNADESEPGSFKDRELLQRAPHVVIEGMILAGLVTGARSGTIYIRHEYADVYKILQEAISLATQEGLLGPSILGTNASFVLELFISPGGYIQGEESALLEAMEDRRGEPRNKPPFPVTHGLFQRPTLINNVETLGWVPAIVLRGGAWYRDQGVNGATGLRLVSVSGDVVRPGVYEVPFGISVRELVLHRAGGLHNGQQLKTIAASGPSGGFLPTWRDGRELLDLSLDHRSVAAWGSMLGGGLIVFGDRADMVAIAQNATEFFRNESCGKCVPCRLGTQRLVELLATIRQEGFDPSKCQEVDELASTLAATSLCGLGQVAANPILTVLRSFPTETGRRQGLEDQASAIGP